MSYALKLIAGLAIVCATFGAAPAMAQQQQTGAPQVISQFDDLTLRVLLNDMQANWTVERGPDGNLIYRAVSDGDLNFTLAPTACRAGEGCTALILIAVFSDLEVANAAQLDAFLHSFNDRNPSAKVVRSENGLIVLQSYVNAIGGISYRNLQAQMLIFGENIIATSRALLFFDQSQ